VVRCQIRTVQPPSQRLQRLYFNAGHPVRLSAVNCHIGVRDSVCLATKEAVLQTCSALHAYATARWLWPDATGI